MCVLSKPGKTQGAGSFLWQRNYLSLKKHNVKMAEVVAQISGIEDEEAAVAAIPTTGTIDSETGAKNEALTGLFDINKKKNCQTRIGLNLLFYQK